MIADFEQLSYTSEMLADRWNDISKIYEQLGDSNFAMNELLELVNWIRSTNLSQFLFPGTSLGRLLISKPDEQGKLNYQQTLKIGFHQESGNYDFSYSDWDLIDKNSEYQKAILWSNSYKPDELRNGLEEFLVWKPEWNNRC